MSLERSPAEAPEGAEPVAARAARAVRFRERDAGRSARRAAPIHAYVGPNGSGKSLAMVHDTLPTLDGMTWACENPDHLHMREDWVNPLTGEVGPQTSGVRRVLSTVRIIQAETGEDHPQYERLTGWRQVLEAEHADLLFDEVTGIANSRASSSMPVQVQTRLDQLRKSDIMLRLTAPAFGRMDKSIRDVCQAVTLCKGMWGKRPEGALWRQNRLFWWKTYDARDLEDFTAAKVNNPSPQTQAYAPRAQTAALMWGPKSRAFATYDTLGAVSRVGDVLDSGRCAFCGGSRRMPPCSCDDAPGASRVSPLPSPTVVVKAEAPA